jgi:hypothetical protein
MRQLYYEGRGTPPPRRPPPPPSKVFMHTQPERFDGGIQPPHMSAQGDGQQFGQPSYSVANGMRSNAYVMNPFMTPPHPTSAAWATQQPTPTVWDGQSSPLTMYDTYTEEARLAQAFKLGTPGGCQYVDATRKRNVLWYYQGGLPGSLDDPSAPYDALPISFA